MGWGDSFPTRIVNRSARHKVWVVVSHKPNPSDEWATLFQIALEPGTFSPKGADVDFVRGYEGAPAVTFNGATPAPGAWWKIKGGFLNAYASIDDYGGQLLLQVARGGIESISGEQLTKWGTKMGTWADVGGAPEPVAGTKPAPQPPAATTPPPPSPAPPTGPKPGGPPPTSSAPSPSTPSPAPPTPGPPPQGLPPAAWLTGVQARLKYLAYYAGPIHDKFDTPTRNAVLAFQGKYGLKVDGIPGPKTQSKLAQVVGA
jgi:hypothetical protein